MRKFEIVAENYIKYGEKDIKMPYRATMTSAGYDLFSPIDIVVKPNAVELIWTNVKATFNSDEVLMLFVTSKMGKNRVMIANGTGIIESDYYSNESNDGNLGIMLYNFGDTDYVVKKHDKIGQGIFLKFLKVDDEKAPTNKRVGGFGSTVK